MSKVVITSAPPKTPTISARTVSSGITSIAATRRGRTRKWIGSSPKVVIAFTSSLTFWVPIWAANAAPVRPANTIAVISAPSSRSIAIPTPFTTKITAPNFCATSPISKAMITPMRKPTSRTIGTALAPASVATSSTSPQLTAPRRVSACRSALAHAPRNPASRFAYAICCTVARPICSRIPIGRRRRAGAVKSLGS